MYRIRICSILTPVLLLFISSINFSQINTEQKKLIEVHSSNSRSNNFPASKNLTLSPDLKGESRTLNPAQYLLRAGSWPYGSSQAVAVDSINKIVYLGSGGAVLVLDAGNPSSPVLLTDAIRTYGLVEDIFIDVSTHRLYLACGEGGYEIWNVEEPYNPFLYSRNEIYYAGVELLVKHVQVTGSFAVFESDLGLINSIDVSDPYNPFQVSFSGVGDYATDLHIDQYGHVHVTGQEEYTIFSLDPSGNLITSGGFPLYDAGAVFGGSQASYVGHGNILYIIYSGGYSTTDVGGIIHIEVRGNLAYIINDNGLQIWNVSDNDNPFLLGSIASDLFQKDLYVAGNYAYVSASGDGLKIYDVNNPALPVLAGEYNTFDGVIDAAISGDYAYTADGNDGMNIVDISNLDYPELAGSIALAGYTTGVTIQNNTAFTCGIEGGLNIIDISDPENPALISSLGNFSGSVIELGNNLVFISETVAYDTSFIRVFDVSDLNNPVQINSLEFHQLIRNMDFRNGYFYVPAYDDGLFIYDFSDPVNPVVAGTISLPAVYDIFLGNNVLYLTSATWSSFGGGIHLYDISDPASPVEIGSYGVPGFFPHQIEVKNEYAYVTDGVQLWLFIIENNNPTFIEKYYLPDLAGDIFARDQYIFVSDFNAGLYIMENNLITNPANSEWIIQESGISQNIWDIDMLDQNKGFAAAEYGIILRTTNGGTNWETSQVGGVLDNFECVAYLNELNCWAGTTTGKLFNTTDGGDNWIEQSIPSTGLIREIDFVNESTGWLITLEDHYILKTTDAGQTWSEQNSGLTGYFRYFNTDFVDENTGYITGAFTQSVPWNYFVIKTTNGGNNWSTIYSTTSFYMASIYFIDQNTGFLGGLFGELYKTTDGGNNWQFINDFGDIIITDFKFTDIQNGWFTGSGGALYWTTDAGETWSEYDLLIPNFLRAIDFVDEESGWIVGDGGIILSTAGTEVTPVELTSFSVNIIDGQVVLNWTTSTEKNNRGFEVERKKSEWETIGFVEGYGTTTNQHNYTFTDKEKLSGTYNYRLKQIDLNGAYKYSDIVEVNLSVPTRFSLEQNYPNPFNPSTTIEYSIPKEGFVNLVIFNVLGQQVVSLVNGNMKAGKYHLIFNASGFASGVYYYRLKSGDQITVKKMIILK